MKRFLAPGLALCLLATTACDDDVDGGTNTCSPACGPCQACDISGAEPVCSDICGADATCQDGKCVPGEEEACAPACGDCQMCDTSGAAAVCVDNCAAGLTCQDGKCVAPEIAKCDPACGPCQVCDTLGDTPTCVDNCAPGLDCNEGACVLPGDPCDDNCVACQRCDTSHGVPFCVDSCREGLRCDTTDEVCRPLGSTGFDHSKLTQLAGPFGTDLDGAQAVTAECLACHAEAGQQMLQSAHWKWTGPTPNLEGHDEMTVGKKNLVNNFCVAVPSNEGRCSQCHAGYGYKDDTFDFTDVGSIDCLVCHAASDYAKAAKTAGLPDPASTNMAAAAQSVGAPSRAACGRCHFKAGGGDNVKKGDIGSALANPAAAADVHMGSATSAFACSSCHIASSHQIPGQGVHLPVSEGRLACIDCHSLAPHTSTAMNNHALDVACQTCHIPAFSRQQPTMMDWDWSTAGNMTRGENGVETGDVDGHAVHVYDAKKGDFVWQKTVRPTYGWYDGRVTRMTLDDTYAEGAGAEDHRIALGGPVATKADAAAKIFPFKVMRGKQAVDTTTRKVLTPKLFGAGGFWAMIPAAIDYDPQTVEDNWTEALKLGARKSGQIADDESFSGRATGDKPWDWAYTEMWMGINHEVALKASALSCNACHGAEDDEWDWEALGYTCDPVSGDAEACGSRHK